MSIITATCNICGDVMVTNREIRLMICEHAGEDMFAFTCPVCEEKVSKFADTQIVDRLFFCGDVEMCILKTPGELSEKHPEGPPFTCDDEISFSNMLREMTSENIMEQVISTAFDPSIVNAKKTR